MEQTSWIWARKSPERSPSGDTWSSESLSSHSEIFSDERNQTIQFPKVVSHDEEQNDRLRTLSEKLEEALFNIRSKEELIKQHEKVAEEAVAGWEKAEDELIVLAHKNSVLEERVTHLDGALKECLRQLRQEREDKEDKINNAIAEKTEEMEAKLTDLSSKLEVAEKENSVLKLSLVLKDEELQMKEHERNLSIQAAEFASKHHLDMIKKVAKLEAESRLFKSVASKTTSVTDDITLERSLIMSSFEIQLMDDFLEMEKIVSEEPETQAKADPFKDERTAEMEMAMLEDQLKQSDERLAYLNAQLDIANQEKGTRLLELESERIKNQEAESRFQIMELELKSLHSINVSLSEEINREKSFTREVISKGKRLEMELLKMESKFRRMTLVEEFRINKDVELAQATAKFSECRSTLASLDLQLKCLASLDNILYDSESEKAN